MLSKIFAAAAILASGAELASAGTPHDKYMNKCLVGTGDDRCRTAVGKMNHISNECDKIYDYNWNYYNNWWNDDYEYVSGIVYVDPYQYAWDLADTTWRHVKHHIYDNNEDLLNRDHAALHPSRDNMYNHCKLSWLGAWWWVWLVVLIIIVVIIIVLIAACLCSCGRKTYDDDYA